MEETEEMKKTKKKYGFWGVFFTALLVSLVVSVVTYRFLGPYLDTVFPQKVEVPDLQGLNPDGAKIVLESRKLIPSLQGETYDIKIPAGNIVSQTPPPGTLTKKNSIVSLIVSKGKEMVILSLLNSLSLDEAKTQIISLGLVVGEVKNRNSKGVPPGKIISSDPKAGTEVLKGTAVNLVVSSGLEKTTVPNLWGKTLSQAQKLLARKRLKLGKILKTCSEQYNFDIILSQIPPANTKVPVGSSVQVTINAEEEEE